MKQQRKDGSGNINKWRSESMWLATTSLVILASVALAFAIAYTRKVMIPFVLALFIVTIASPILDFQVLRLRIPRFLAVTSTLIVVLVVTTLVCGTLWKTGLTIVSTANTYEKGVGEMFTRASEWFEAAKARFPFNPEEDPEEKQGGSVAEQNTPTTSVDPVTSSGPTGSQALETFELSVTPESLAQGTQGAQANPLPLDSLANSIQLEVTAEGLRVEPLPQDVSGTLAPPKKRKAAPGDLLDFNKLVALVVRQVGDALWTMVDVLLQLLSKSVFVIIFVIFMLAGKNPRVVRTGVYAEIDQKIRRYIGTKVAISLVTGMLVWFTLDKLDMELAGVFGILAFLLNFIPSLGSIVSTLLPIPIALAQYHNQPLLVVLVVLIPGIIQIVMGNVIEPKLMGEGLNLHPITVLLALSFWGLLWGVVGMFLAAPMTAVIRIVLMQFDTLKPVGRLLAGELPQDPHTQDG